MGHVPPHHRLSWISFYHTTSHPQAKPWRNEVILLRNTRWSSKVHPIINLNSLSLLCDVFFFCGSCTSMSGNLLTVHPYYQLFPLQTHLLLLPFIRLSPFCTWVLFLSLCMYFHECFLSSWECFFTPPFVFHILSVFSSISCANFFDRIYVNFCIRVKLEAFGYPYRSSSGTMSISLSINGTNTPLLS